MRRTLIPGLALAAILLPAVASAQVYAADVYTPGTTYVAPGPGAVVVNPPLVQSEVYLAPNTAYRAPGTAYVAPGAAYVAPPATAYVAPGTPYEEQPVYINGQRYFRDCWWDWGRRRCELKPWW